MNAMARKEVVSLLCDVCGAAEAHRYAIFMPQGRFKIDLCEEHAEPLRELRRLKRVRPSAMRARRVLSTEEAKRL